MAAAFAGAGHRLGLCARTIPSAPAGAQTVTAPVDVTDARALEEFGATVVERFGRIDLWVNNAGVIDPIGRLADVDAELIRRHIDTNVTGVLFGSRVFALHVRTRPGPGVLINISSGAGRSPYQGWAAYCGSKAAVDMITEVIALEECASGLRAYAVAPGLVDTDMQRLIRATPIEQFPGRDRFDRAYEARAFNSTSWVAQYVLGLLEDEPEAATPGASDVSDGVVSVFRRVPDQPRHH
jgi:benzil reductase ((S)-benzoin forming)